MSSKVKGVVVLARNGDRKECYQDPKTYKYGPTESTPLGEVQAYQLGQKIRQNYFNPSSSSYIPRISADLVDLKQVHVRVKIGSEGTSVFDSTTALLQGLFPPNPKNRIALANDTVVVAPLGGYQYIPVETVEPYNDLSLESWTGCPAFEKHISRVHASDEFVKKAREAQPFLQSVRDYIFGRPATLDNIWNIYDYMNSELTHNRTYAYRLPPFSIHQARALVNYHESAIFTDTYMNGIGNIAGRTTLHSILTALERISFDHDPLQFLLIGTTYQPFISLLGMTEVTKYYPQMAGLPEYASALVIELIGGSPPDVRDFVRIKFKNGTQDDDFQTINVFGHNGDMALTEFIYRLEGAVIDSPYEWNKVCNTGYRYDAVSTGVSPFGIAANPSNGNIYGIGANLSGGNTYIPNPFEMLLGLIMTILLIAGVWMTTKFVKNRRAASKRIQLPITHEAGIERTDIKRVFY